MLRYWGLHRASYVQLTWPLELRWNAHEARFSRTLVTARRAVQHLMFRAPARDGPLLAASPRKRRSQRSRRVRSISLWVTAIVAVLLFCFSVVAVSRENLGGLPRFESPVRKAGRGRILDEQLVERTAVVYVFSGTDPEYERNLHFFIETGIQEDSHHEYFIVIQMAAGLSAFQPRPALPPNARFVEHANECFDWGTIGWLLSTSQLDYTRFKYFIWLNSSGRGPFLPPYYAEISQGASWTRAFTAKLTDKVKLVGSSISCGGAYTYPPTPHVQTYAVATDRQGLEVLLAKGTVFRCWANIAETVIHSEIGSSVAIREAGFNLDSLMLRYQGLDWRDPSLPACNAGLNPIQEGFYDGIDVNPLEVLFIKVKGSMKAAGWGHVQQAVKYDAWASSRRHDSAQARGASLASNDWHQRQNASIAAAQKRGPRCFDVDFYVSANRFDLGWIMSNADPHEAGWLHYMAYGIGEGRPARFTC